MNEMYDAADELMEHHSHWLEQGDGQQQRLSEQEELYDTITEIIRAACHGNITIEDARLLCYACNLDVNHVLPTKK